MIGVRLTVPRLSTIRSLDVPTLRAACWTLGALRRTRRALRTLPVDEVVVRMPPPLPAHAGRGVHAILRRVPNTCLERALVLQQWLSEQGDVRDVVIGVTGQESFRAHAWLEGEPTRQEFHELTRLRRPTR